MSYAGQVADDIPHYQKTTEIRNPMPVNLLVFLEVHQDEILDTEFGIPVEPDWWSVGYWWDIPANRHNQGANFTFADGHVEHWHWEAPKAMTVPRGQAQPVRDDEWDDYATGLRPASAKTSRIEAKFRLRLPPTGLLLSHLA